jgi:hypothetical protein
MKSCATCTRRFETPEPFVTEGTEDEQEITERSGLLCVLGLGLGVLCVKISGPSVAAEPLWTSPDISHSATRCPNTLSASGRCSAGFQPAPVSRRLAPPVATASGLDSLNPGSQCNQVKFLKRAEILYRVKRDQPIGHLSSGILKLGKRVEHQWFGKFSDFRCPMPDFTIPPRSARRGDEQRRKWYQAAPR